MARPLLIVIALVALLASAVPLAPLVALAVHAWAPLLTNLHGEADVRAALWIAGTVAAVSVPIGLCLALVIGRASHWVRVLIFALCVVLLLQQGSGLSAGALSIGALHYPPRTFVLLSLAAAVCRDSSVSILLLSAGVSRIPDNLRRAARAAGARPLQAWRDAVLRPLAWPLLTAFIAAFMVGLSEGPLRSPLFPGFAVFGAAGAAPAFLLAIASLAALGALLRRRPA